MLKCRVFDVLSFAVFQQCKIKTAKQKTASLTLAVLMVEIRGFEPLAYALRTHRSTN